MDMDDGDIEIDSCPLPAPDSRHFGPHNEDPNYGRPLDLSKHRNLDIDERLDSRLSSGYLSIENLPSGNLPSDLTEARAGDRIEGTLNVETLKSLEELKITPDLTYKAEKVSDVPNLPSVDEGFVSRDLKSTERLLPDEPQEQEGAVFTEDADRKRIQQYLHFVDETFSQDEDGDT